MINDLLLAIPAYLETFDCCDCLVEQPNLSPKILCIDVIGFAPFAIAARLMFNSPFHLSDTDWKENNRNGPSQWVCPTQSLVFDYLPKRTHKQQESELLSAANWLVLVSSSGFWCTLAQQQRVRQGFCCRSPVATISICRQNRIVWLPCDTPVPCNSWTTATQRQLQRRNYCTIRLDRNCPLRGSPCLKCRCKVGYHLRHHRSWSDMDKNQPNGQTFLIW